MEVSDRFLGFISSRWNCFNTYDKNYKSITHKSGVYLFVSVNLLTGDKKIVYVGSSTDLLLRYKSHNVRNKIESDGGRFAIFYFKEMEKGFYDFEIKLIKALSPIFNTQHIDKRNGDGDGE